MSLPLSGRTILVTRPAHQASALVEPLEAHGATVVRMPAVSIEPPHDFNPLDAALGSLHRYDSVVLTSTNGVDAIASRLDHLGIARSNLSELYLAVIGPATAAKLRTEFREPDLVPSEYVSEAIAEALGEVAGRRFLLARADLARPALADILRRRGAVVDEVVTYRIVPSTDQPELPDKAPDLITLTSSASVHAVREALSARHRDNWMREADLACIGPVTASAVREIGLSPTLIARDYTVPGLIAAVLEHYA